MTKLTHSIPAVAGEEDPPTEISRLLMPSPISTDRASADDPRRLLEEGSIPLLKKAGSGSAVSEIQLRSFASLDQLQGTGMNDCTKGKKGSPAYLVAVVAIVVATVSAVSLLLMHNAEIPALMPHGEGKDNVNSWNFNSRPLSLMDPVKDAKLPSYQRPSGSRPKAALSQCSVRDGSDEKLQAFPTNAWYQNLLLVDGEPSVTQQTYSIPYIVDAVGPIPGLRLHPNHIGGASDVVQVYSVDEYGLTLGAAVDAFSSKPSKHSASPSREYGVQQATNLGVTLKWDYFPMASSIVKGMPYGTMVYDQISHESEDRELLLPTIASQISLLGNPVADEEHALTCDGGTSKPQLVKRELELLFAESDFTWLVFFSEPVYVQCFQDNGAPGAKLQVLGRERTEAEAADESLVVRIALFKSCSSGTSPIYCHQEQMHPTALLLGQGDYGTIIRSHVHLYPGPNTQFRYTINPDDKKIHMELDWDPREMGSKLAVKNASEIPGDLIAFALPHHLSILENNRIFREQIYCTASLVGPACLVEGKQWNLTEDVPDIGFRAPRPPAMWALSALADAVQDDIMYRLPEVYRRGAGDTYFSGKMLAKLGRILLVADELREVCSETQTDVDYRKACKGLHVPSIEDISVATSTLRSSVEIWLNGTSETPFVFDSSWGGVVNCGCDYNGKKCNNKFPDCPAFSDPGLNFGNGFYNDMHFHYGYHIYAAAVVAHLDPAWGRNYFERVLLLIRDIANPSESDNFFPTWRHKDWYQGHSWASGIANAYLNGRNQESSSEAIAAYEAIALYGNVMSRIWEKNGAERERQVADQVRGIGQVLTATELKAARTYWHVSRSPKNELKIYPASYTPTVVGIVWQMMVQFQTWFGRAAYLMYGIQLLPLTPVSELRDDLEWSKQIYPEFAQSCEGDVGCTESGWSVLQIAMLATVGHPTLALERVLNLAKEQFDDAAGNGHSKSNTIWFVATRPEVDHPIHLQEDDTQTVNEHHGSSVDSDNKLTDCHRPDSCSDFVLDTIAGLYSCRQRIQWLMTYMGKTQEAACSRVAGVENPVECGLCNPNGTVIDVAKKEHDQQLECPPCSEEECASDLNRCPRYQRTFVCTEGANRGGCSGSLWSVESDQCSTCCELTSCPRNDAIQAVHGTEDFKETADCPVCTPEMCHKKVNQCPLHGAPFLCYEGPSLGGCSPRPWQVTKQGQCTKCCRLNCGN